MTFQPITRLALASLAFATAAVCAQPAATIQVEQAWARPTVAGQLAGGGFVTLRNTGSKADKLIGGSTPAAKRLELHSMKLAGDVMQMEEVGSVDLPAGQTVALKPGGLHIMLMGLQSPLKIGSSIPVTLKFEKAGEITVDMRVQVNPSAAAPQQKH